MSRIAAGSAEGAEQGYRPYLQAALLMGLFTFLFFMCGIFIRGRAVPDGIRGSGRAGAE